MLLDYDDAENFPTEVMEPYFSLEVFPIEYNVHGFATNFYFGQLSPDSVFFITQYIIQHDYNYVSIYISVNYRQ
jgi:hypothetical protein